MSQMWPRSLAGSEKEAAGAWGPAGARARWLAAMSLKINWVISCGVGGTRGLPTPVLLSQMWRWYRPTALSARQGTRLQGDGMIVFSAELMGLETQRRGQGKATIGRKG